MSNLSYNLLIPYLIKLQWIHILNNLSTKQLVTRVKRTGMLSPCNWRVLGKNIKGWR